MLISNRAIAPDLQASIDASSPPTRPNFASLSAIAAGIALTLASAAANVTSAIGKQEAISGKLIAGTVAASVAILAAVSLAAALRSASERKIGAALVCFLAFVLAGTYSVTSALGVLGSPRLSAFANANQGEELRTRLNEERARTLGELATLAPARLASELNPQIASLLGTSGIGSPPCATLDGPVTRRVCPALAMLQEEAARSYRIAALNGTIARIEADLSKAGPPVLDNADARSLAHVLAALGVPVRHETLAVALLVLAVVILECGAGLAFAVAAALRTSPTAFSGQPSMDTPRSAKTDRPSTCDKPQDISVNQSSRLLQLGFPAGPAPLVMTPRQDTEINQSSSPCPTVNTRLGGQATRKATPRRGRTARLGNDVARARALRVLEGIPESPSVRTLAKLARISKSAAHDALKAHAARTTMVARPH